MVTVPTMLVNSREIKIKLTLNNPYMIILTKKPICIVTCGIDLKLNYCDHTSMATLENTNEKIFRKFSNVHVRIYR